MIPVIVKLGPIPVNSFGLMVALAVIASIHRLGLSFEQNGIDRKLAEPFVFAGALSGLAGARLWYIIEHYSLVRDDLLGAVFAGSGFTFTGGFVVAFFVLLYLCRKYSVSCSSFLDSVGPTMALGYAVGRVGCQLAGDGDYGIVTTSFVGMSYATGVVPTAPGVLVYPTPFFESVMMIGACFLLLKLDKCPRFQSPFVRWGVYLVLAGVERFLIEFIRVKPKYAFGLSEAHYVSFVITLIGICLVGRGLRRGSGAAQL